MATVDPKEKIERSRLLASAYTTSSLLQSEQAIDTQVALLLRWMDEYASSSKPMNLSKFFTFIAYDIMGEPPNSLYIEHSCPLLSFTCKPFD